MDKMSNLKRELQQMLENVDLDMRVAEIGKRNNDDRSFYTGKIEVLREHKYNINYLLQYYFGDVE